MPTLIVDAGNSLTFAPGEASTREPAQRTMGQTSVEALKRLGYDAVALGPKDLLIGRDELSQRLSEAEGLVFLSANVRDASTGDLVAKPYIVKRIRGHRVALIGITGSASESTEFSVADPLDAARQYVAEVQPQADVIILLSNASTSQNKAIGEQVPGIDILISGSSTLFPQALRLEGGTLIAQADVSAPYDAGRNVGWLRVDLDQAGAVKDYQWTQINLSPSVPDDPEMAAWARELTGG